MDKGSDGWRDSADEWTLDLLESASREEATNPIRKQRVWVALSRTSGRRVRPIWRTAMRTAIVAGVLGVAAGASATLGHWSGWAVRAYERLVPSDNGRSSALDVGGAQPAPRLRGRSVSRTRSEAAPAIASTGQEAVPPAPPAESAPAAREQAAQVPGASSLAASRPVASRHSVTPYQEMARRGDRRQGSGAAGDQQAARSGKVTEGDLTGPALARNDETRPVLAAMRALRRDKDAPRARALLREYLRKHPQGTLAEEALAISIEAAVANGDTDSRVLARRYLDRYPGGPFRALAIQALNDDARLR